MSEMKIYPALLAITDDLCQTGIGKNAQTTGGGNFMYRSIDAVYAALSPLLVKHKVVIFPENVCRKEDVQSGKMRLVRLTVTYRAVSTEDGSSITFESIGEGCDNSDKAAGKAMSYAYKTAIFQVFCVPVEGQEDPDSVVHQIDQAFIPAALSQQAYDLLDDLNRAETIADLKEVGTRIKALNLPPESKEYEDLTNAYVARRDAITARNN